MLSLSGRGKQERERVMTVVVFVTLNGMLKAIGAAAGVCLEMPLVEAPPALCCRGLKAEQYRCL